MRVYLAGPMTGYEDYNYPAFHAMAEHLREQGHEVINPAEHFGGDQALPYRDYMRRDLGRLLHDVNAIVLLCGWAGSPGAYLEYLVAVATELRIYTQRDPSSLDLMQHTSPHHGPRAELSLALSSWGWV